MATPERSAKGGRFPVLFAIRVRIYRPPFGALPISKRSAIKRFDEANSAHDDARRTFASPARRRALTINNDFSLKPFRACGGTGRRTEGAVSDNVVRGGDARTYCSGAVNHIALHRHITVTKSMNASDRARASNGEPEDCRASVSCGEEAARCLGREK
jgi:hypothetical protein